MVWRRPALTATELLWRWGAGAPLAVILIFTVGRALKGVPINVAGLEAMTVFKPTEALATMGEQLSHILPAIVPGLRWWVPCAVALWTLASVWGKGRIWRQLEPGSQPRFLSMAAFTFTRMCALLAVLALWVWGLVAASTYTVTAPARSGAEPNLVLFVALAVALTLVLFMLWSAASWVIDAAPLFAMQTGHRDDRQVENRGAPGLLGSLRAAVRAPGLGPKLIETNLVMGIVKVALLVLAMVFSASPLPFATVETAAFLAGWWSFVALLYLAFSDFFQVVRRATYLRLFRVLVTPGVDTTSTPRDAS